MCLSLLSQRLRTVVKREADLKLQKIALKYEIKGREIYDKSVMAHFVEEQRRQKVQEEMRLQDIEKVSERIHVHSTFSPGLPAS